MIEFGANLQGKGKVSVVSVCSHAHLDVWKLTSALLREYVYADEYLVYVPEEYMRIFRRSTPDYVTVESERKLGQSFGPTLARAVEDAGNGDRFGWYFQQFLKIQALLASDSEQLIIWDADCVPVRPQELFSSDGKPVYGRAFEYHEPYFDNIQRLMGMKRVQDQSFVIPGFPIFREWVHEWSDFVRTRLGTRSWFDAIQVTTDFKLRAGFSEFETLGTWIANTHIGEWASRDIRWERLGQSRFGYARNLSPGELLKLGNQEDLDVISFENWDGRGLRRAMKRLRNRAPSLPRLNSMLPEY